jgi:hypothetical protein
MKSVRWSYLRQISHLLLLSHFPIQLNTLVIHQYVLKESCNTFIEKIEEKVKRANQAK